MNENAQALQNAQVSSDKTTIMIKKSKQCTERKEEINVMENDTLESLWYYL